MTRNIQYYMSTFVGFTRAAIHRTRGLAWRAASTPATTHPPSHLFPTTQTRQQHAKYFSLPIFILFLVARSDFKKSPLFLTR